MDLTQTVNDVLGAVDRVGKTIISVLPTSSPVATSTPTPTDSTASTDTASKPSNVGKYLLWGLGALVAFEVYKQARRS